MQSGKIWDDFTALPIEAQRQVADFVAFLRQRYSQTETKRETKPPDMSQEPFVGMWRDRTDLRDSTEWVRNLRQQEWTREP